MSSLDALSRPSGTFAMVAMDQRESLRTMLRDHGHDAGDERVRALQGGGRAGARAARVRAS